MQMLLITQLGEKNHNELDLQAATGRIWQPHKRLREKRQSHERYLM